MWLPFTWPLLGTWPVSQACALTGNRTGKPLVLRLALNPLSHTSQGSIIFLKHSSNFFLNHIENPKILRKHMKRFASFEEQVGNPRSGSPDPTPSSRGHQRFENHADGRQHKIKQNTLWMGLGVKKNNKKRKLRVEVYPVPKCAGRLSGNSSNAQTRILLA